jgi:activator of HSP90 ATPase
MLMPKNLIITALMPATPQTLFDMYLDPASHAAFTGSSVTIDPRPGAPFRAFGGSISGTMLHIEPKRLIVQTWRSIHFSDEDIDSVLVLSFWPEEGGARIELTQVNVADRDFAGVSEGWEKYYWAPWRASLQEAKNVS